MCEKKSPMAFIKFKVNFFEDLNGKKKNFVFLRRKMTILYGQLLLNITKYSDNEETKSFCCFL